MSEWSVDRIWRPDMCRYVDISDISHIDISDSNAGHVVEYNIVVICFKLCAPLFYL